jgi:hypothetical protein
MNLKKRIEKIEEKLNINQVKEKRIILVNVVNSQGEGCPLSDDERKLEQCLLYQKKHKEGNEKEIHFIALDCRKQCPYLSKHHKEAGNQP